MVILLHTSKTMRHDAPSADATQVLFPDEVTILSKYLQSLSVAMIQKIMALSSKKAQETYELIQSFNDTAISSPAIDMFLGDIYSGFQTQTLSSEDRAYAQDNHLFILSGLYGVLRPLDGIQPYRLEMGYKLPGNAHDRAQPDISSLYTFWGEKIARVLPTNTPILNLSAVEYTKVLFTHFKHIDGLKSAQIITPKFLTVSPKTGEPTFVTVHAKIARGAFARWVIQQRIEDTSMLNTFAELGYRYVAELSTPEQPVFVAEVFKGIGLSVRLT